MVYQLALTTGEPAGIGPELAVQAARWFVSQKLNAQLTLIGDAALLQSYGLDLTALPGVKVLPVALQAPVQAGQLNPQNSRYVLDTLDQGIQLIDSGLAQALVTAPVHKKVINQAGFAFSGHTEYFQHAAGVDKVVMMLVGAGLRVALATTHLPLRQVADAIQTDSLRAVLQILHHDLKYKFGLAQPRIAVCGLNPHAGEGGYLGSEEIEVITPLIHELNAAGFNLTGPLPADTIFVPRQVQAYDAVLAMYHDQGLPVLKHASFGLGVNVTLGLPYIRTSVDHGTALDLAGKGQADVGSLQQAILIALQMLKAQASPV